VANLLQGPAHIVGRGHTTFEGGHQCLFEIGETGVGRADSYCSLIMAIDQPPGDSNSAIMSIKCPAVAMAKVASSTEMARDAVPVL
jgi:hypothetical protein